MGASWACNECIKRRVRTFARGHRFPARSTHGRRDSKIDTPNAALTGE
jgi:hypothetical protein